MDEYKDFINNYLKIKWEKLNQEKHNSSILKMIVIKTKFNYETIKRLPFKRESLLIYSDNHRLFTAS